MRYSMSYYLLIGANLLKYSVFLCRKIKKYKQIFIRNKCIKIHNVKFVRFVHFVKFKFNTVIVAIF
ncbi:hypothetical protein SGA02_19340 [Staphylococcus gallinarum]|uniref:Uncharacterized protein n=1 Tax=Staphylococcus gallinarum TaxID=1293 RepID=A0ABQ0Y3X2_STAGA|nr:hypothetical protein SGA02_19340 [Staphylococcus gallinarum]